MPRTVAERADTLPALAEVFREYGYNGASLALISKATGLGKGSLYNFFPGGKAEMATAVLEEIEVWFETNIFTPLVKASDLSHAMTDMFDAVVAYFQSGQRICLVGSLALNDPEDRFVSIVSRYFVNWIDALTHLFENAGYPDARDLAEEVVIEIQGGIILTRALNDPELFQRRIEKLKHRVLPSSGTNHDNEASASEQPGE